MSGWGINTGYGWHTDKYDSYEVPELATGNRALDIQFTGGTAILSPITGVAYRKCSDINGSTIVIRPNSTPNGTYGGSGMRILHMASDNNFNNTQDISYAKGQQIGTVKTGLLPYNSANPFPCGAGGTGDHIHLK